MTIDRFYKMHPVAIFRRKGEGSPVELRVSRTCRAGVYGHQYAAALWVAGQLKAVTSLTGGCGYSKDAYTACEALMKAGFPYDGAPSMAGSGRIREALALAFGGDFEEVGL